MKYFTKSDAALAKDSAEVGLKLKLPFQLINSQLYTVEERIRVQAREFDNAVEGYVSYACETGGKRLRPALVLLSGASTGSISPGHIDLAVIIELIHVATLVHDDIIDGAELRREQPTVNAKWGNSLSVLLGDCLFAHALKLSTRFHNTDVSRRIADAACEVCSGEIIQTQRRFDLKMTVADYFRIIEMKTAALFAAAAELGAFISEADPEVILAMKQFGLKLGTAYQIYDDCLDLAGTEDVAGKTLRSDLRRGKLTLPVLYCLQHADEAERETICQHLLQADDQDVEELVRITTENGGLNAAIQTALRMVTEARDSLRILNATRYRNALEVVCDYLGQLLKRLS